MEAAKNAFSQGVETVGTAVDAATNAKRAQLEADTIKPTSGCPMTTYFGTKVSDTDNSLKAGVGGPTLLEDFHNREKISAFDHERIPERVVHARGAAAHGTFKLHTAIPEFSKAGVLNDTSRTTPVFLRFSTVAGSRGSADSVRDVRGFAVRFYTEEGNWDIVGNNIPSFFVQDAIKFLDLIHAVKPEPHNEIPQAQTAHDNAWDFFSLAPETMHTLLWAMSDRGIPRSFRMMNGFGVNTFTLVNDEGKRSFVKFHWIPKLGVHGLVWDEALKLGGQDPDFHRRDLHDAIESGAFPEWELAVQILAEEDEHKFDFSILDATKIWPEELVPIKKIGTMQLNRNVDEYFPETEQVAFCTQHIVPGIDFSNDPLLQGRNFSYFDTQISRIGVNFKDLPINRPVCPVFSNIRDGQMARVIHKSTVNYSPNRFDSPKVVPPSEGSFEPYPAPVSGVKSRERPAKFNEYFNQPAMFYNSLDPVEQQHIISAIQFELGKCEDEGVQQRSINNLNKVNHDLAVQVAYSLTLEAPAEVDVCQAKSEYLSMIHGKHQVFTAEGRKVAIYVLEGFDAKAVMALKAAITAAKAIPVVVGDRQKVKGSDGVVHKGDFTLETSRSTHFDAIAIVGGSGANYASKLNVGRLVHAAREAYMHQKAIMVLGQAVDWLAQAALPGQGLDLSGQDGLSDGIVYSRAMPVSSLKTFLDVVANHRVWSRDVSTVAA